MGMGKVLTEQPLETDATNHRHQQVLRVQLFQDTYPTNSEMHTQCTPKRLEKPHFK